MLRNVYVSLSQWWASKTVRDQRILGAAFVLAIGLAWYQLVWAPLDAARRTAKAEIKRIEAAFLILERLPADGVNADPGPGGLQAFVADTIAAEGLEIAALESRENGIKVSFETAPFEGVARWLDAVLEVPGVRLASARIERRPEPGTVSAEIDLDLR